MRHWTPGFPLDLRMTLGVHRRGGGDPAYAVTPDGAHWRAVYTPDGPGTLRLRVTADTVEARAWGDGADWLLEQTPKLLGADDDPAALRPVHEPVRAAARNFPGLRLSRSDRVWEALAPAVLEQKVTGREAWRAWRTLLLRHGTVAPGPGVAPPLRVPPPQHRWPEIPSWEWHRAGAEPVRMRTLIGAAAVAVEHRPERLAALPGIGPWTVAEVLGRSVGDPDAVPVGDYHLPSMVGHALIGAAVDDTGMLELLEPYRGQRGRVIRLLAVAAPSASGRERRGPRMTTRDYRRI